MTRKGFRPHPMTLTLAHSLFPIASSSTQLFVTIMQESLSLPPASPDDLRQLHEKILLLESSNPQKTLTSKGQTLTTNRYPLISLYLTDEQMTTLNLYHRTFPLFQTLTMTFKHALFTTILNRQLPLSEIIHLFSSPRANTTARTRQGKQSDPFLSARQISLATLNQPDPQTGLVPTIQLDESTPTQQDILAHLTDLLTPPLVLPLPEQLSSLRHLMTIGQSHALFPHPQCDYTPILDKALSLQGGLLSQDLLSALFPAAPTGAKKKPRSVSTETHTDQQN